MEDRRHHPARDGVGGGAAADPLSRMRSDDLEHRPGPADVRGVPGGARVSYARIDDLLAHQRPIMEAGKAGPMLLGWHLAGHQYAERHRTDGVIPQHGLRLLCPGAGPPTPRVLEQLQKAGLWEPLDAGAWRLIDYLEWNSPFAVRSQQARHAARVRWDAQKALGEHPGGAFEHVIDAQPDAKRASDHARRAALARWDAVRRRQAAVLQATPTMAFQMRDADATHDATHDASHAPHGDARMPLPRPSPAPPRPSPEQKDSLLPPSSVAPPTETDAGSLARPGSEGSDGAGPLLPPDEHLRCRTCGEEWLGRPPCPRASTHAHEPSTVGTGKTRTAPSGGSS